MQGIEENLRITKANQYKDMYELHKQGKTYEEIGKQYNITKQRVHQIISCCRISGGDYYVGRKLAREYKTEIQAKQDAKVLFKQWLHEKVVKIALNNKDFTTYA